MYEKSKNIDVYCKSIILYDNAIGTGTVGLKAKKEGDLVISGTEGYIYVPSPWWRTEIRDDNGNVVQRIADKFDGDGLRYEIAEFLSMIHKKSQSYKLRKEDSIVISEIMESFFNQIHENKICEEIRVEKN